MCRTSKNGDEADNRKRTSRVVKYSAIIHFCQIRKFYQSIKTQPL